MPFEFLLYKFYIKMLLNEDEHPVFRTFVYMNINILFTLFSLAVLIQGLIKFLNSHNIISFSLTGNFSIGAIILFITSCLFNYFRFFYKRDISSYVEKYKHHKLNDYFFTFVLYIFPFILFIIGPIISVLFFGGTIFGHTLKGFLN